MDTIQKVRANADGLRKLYNDFVANPIDVEITAKSAESARLYVLDVYRAGGVDTTVDIEKMLTSDDSTEVFNQCYNFYLNLPESMAVHQYSGFHTLCDILERE